MEESMTVLMWDKPKKVRSKKEWEEHTGFDGGPTGGYAPNMSDDDANRWKAKLVGTKTGFPQVEIRKAAGSALMTIIVNLGYGYNYKQYTVTDDRDYAKSRYSDREAEFYRLIARSTSGINVHVSANGPMQMTFADIEDMQSAIDEAKAALQEHLGQTGRWTPYIVKAAPEANLDSLRDEMVGYGAIHCETYDVRRFIWIAATHESMAGIVGLPGIREIETRDELLARSVAFMNTDRYYHRLGEFE